MGIKSDNQNRQHVRWKAAQTTCGVEGRRLAKNQTPPRLRGLRAAPLGLLRGPRKGNVVCREDSAAWHCAKSKRPENRHVTCSNGCHIYLNVDG